VVTEILQEPNEKSITQMISERAERGWALYLTKRQLITKTGVDTYTVPSSADGTCAVHYGADVEDCTCTDYSVHRGILSCKHLQAIGIMHAARRAPARRSEATCLCHCGYHYIGHMVESQDDLDGEVVEYERVPCKRCNK